MPRPFAHDLDVVLPRDLGEFRCSRAYCVAKMNV